MIKIASPFKLLALALLVFAASAQMPLLAKEEPAHTNHFTSIGEIVEAHGENDLPSDKWAPLAAWMKDVTTYDALVNRVEAVLCSNSTNKSTLIVGPPSESFKYVFARIAAKDVWNPNRKCQNRDHVEINLDVIKGGSSLPGVIEERWQTKVLDKAEDAAIVLYFSNLSKMIGLGAGASGTGLEAQFAENITSGKLKTVVYVDQIQYKRILNTRHSQLINSFELVIKMPTLDDDQVYGLLENYLSNFADHLGISKESATYLSERSEYFQPAVVQPDRSLSLLKAIVRMKSDANASVQIGRAEINKAIQEVMQVPGWIVERNWNQIKDLRAKLDKKVIAQDLPKADVVRIVRNGLIAGRTDGRPAGAALFVGPTGVGKSYLSKKLAEALGLRMVQFDMTQYTDASSADRFIDVMAQNLVNDPFGIYVFEEIDKAAIEVLDKFHLLLEEGVFYDRNQAPIFARGAVYVFTTNAAQYTIIDNKTKSDEELKTLVQLELEKQFHPSFLNRFDAISIFKPFDHEGFKKLAVIISSEKIDFYRENNQWEVSLDSASIEFMATKGRSEKYGARPIRNLIDAVFAEGLTEYELNYGKPTDGSKIRFDYKKTRTVNGREVAEFKIFVGPSTVSATSVTYYVDLHQYTGK